MEAMLDEKKLNFIRKNKNEDRDARVELMDQSNEILNMLKDFIGRMKNFEIASILLSMKRWIGTKGKVNRVNFKRADIVEIDLGLGYGFEMSYLHPCIILQDSSAGFCFVAPCSTGKFGKVNKYIINGYINDGFKSNTGVLIDSIRCISKTRINKKVGEVSLEFYDKLNIEIVKEYFQKQNLEVRNLKRDYERLLEENIELKKHISNNSN